MASNLNEKSVRNWLRFRFAARELEWVEPTWGSRTGLPDVNLNLIDEKLPLELKCWDETRRGVRHEVRPSQIRYHWLEHRAGRRSAFLVLVRGKYPRLLAFAGQHASPDPYPSDVSWMHLVCPFQIEADQKQRHRERMLLLWLLKSNDFWSGK